MVRLSLFIIFPALYSSTLCMHSLLFWHTVKGAPIQISRALLLSSFLPCGTLPYRLQQLYRYSKPNISDSSTSWGTATYSDSFLLCLDSSSLLCGPKTASKYKARAITGRTSLVSLFIDIFHCLLSSVVLHILLFPSIYSTRAYSFHFLCTARNWSWFFLYIFTSIGELIHIKDQLCLSLKINSPNANWVDCFSQLAQKF